MPKDLKDHYIEFYEQGFDPEVAMEKAVIAYADETDQIFERMKGQDDSR